MVIQGLLGEKRFCVRLANGTSRIKDLLVQFCLELCQQHLHGFIILPHKDWKTLPFYRQFFPLDVVVKFNIEKTLH